MSGIGVTEHVKAWRNEQQKRRKMNASRRLDDTALWRPQLSNSSKIRGFEKSACGDDAGSASQPALVHFSTLLAARQQLAMNLSHLMMISAIKPATSSTS